MISRVEVSRRRFIQGSASASMLAAAGGLTLSGIVGTVEAAVAGPLVGIGFTSVPADTAPVADAVTVPAGYTAKALVAWGDPIVAGGVAYKADATNSAAEQAKQYGMHTDGMHFFPLPEPRPGAQ